jgi:hypothetical protein
MDKVQIITSVAGLIGLAVGPGGVFYFMVKKGLNGSLDAVARMDRSIAKISSTQDKDHDTLTKTCATLEVIGGESARYHRVVERNTLAIAAVKTRCDIFHRDAMNREVDREDR